MSFETLGLEPKLLSAIVKTGFTTPTPVQEAAIPKALAGQDLMVSAQTGSGKTAAFMLPALNRIAKTPANKGSGVQVLVLTPTRELAMQVADATKAYGAHIPDLRIAVVVGGMPYGAQLKALSRRVDVLVATPGRLIDHLQARRVNLSTVHTLVLDEADRMLDMGFIEDIETIVAATPASRQTLLFSATLDGTIARLARDMLNEPLRIEVSGHKQKHDNITQSLLYADDAGHKLRLLDHLLRDTNLDQAIVFTSTKRGADDLAVRLTDQGFSAASLHGDMNQRQRTRTLGLMQKRRVQILVATDVAARGIDVQGISHAINYDLPMQPEDYTHRIGRTGRAGNSGLAFTLATHSERHKIRRIEHFIGQPIPSNVIEGLEPTKTARPTYTERKGKGGKRFEGGRGGFGGKPGQGRPGEGRKAGGSFGDKARYAGKPFEERAGGAGKPRFDDKPAYDSRADGDRPARRFDDRAGSTSRPTGYADRDNRSYKTRDERGGYKGQGEQSSSKPFGARADRPGFGDAPRGARASFGDRPAAKHGKPAAKAGGFSGRSARPSFGDKPAARSKSAGSRRDFA
ncbi:MAG TPA: DEAD/DEAH box helicase [Pusillimonas sp.]|uniref:DEAD/DEAH box helicase n=1 Tax=Pusillimonas sp. TaxID=3040095 RepID=UPI002BC33A0F|nr:DEAD/DEAH box helicase [Pusillimonas sp.]HUH88875.1 DEAD/DEAH box helicase [Pusillimonas sp.]